MDKVSETIREPWQIVFDMGVVEFLNILCYSMDKAEFERKKIKEWQKKN